MYPKFVFVILLLACGSAYSADLELQPIMQQHQRAMQMLMRTFNQSPNARAAEVSTNECFDYYNKAQAATTEKYNKEYNGCEDTAKAAKEVLSQQSTEQRAALVKSGQDICSELSGCEDNSDGLAFFQCYHKTSSNNVNNMFGLSSDSESAYNTLSVQYKKVDDDQTVCTSSARNEYVTSLSTCATNLNNCLMGEWVPPGESTSTEGGSSALTTTPEPSTEADIPESTSAEPEAPEEDVMRYVPMTRMNMWNILRRQ